jgi:hypothetical protein
MYFVPLVPLPLQFDSSHIERTALDNVAGWKSDALVAVPMNRDFCGHPERGLDHRKHRSWLETGRSLLEIMP